MVVCCSSICSLFVVCGCLLCVVPWGLLFVIGLCCVSRVGASCGLLCVVCYVLFAACWLVFAVRRLLFIVGCWLLIGVCWLLPFVACRCGLLVVCRLLCVVRCLVIGVIGLHVFSNTMFFCLCDAC